MISFSVVESFESIGSTFAQQLAVNETQSFTAPSLTLVTELVSAKLGSLALLYFVIIHLTFRTVLTDFLSMEGAILSVS